MPSGYLRSRSGIKRDEDANNTHFLLRINAHAVYQILIYMIQLLWNIIQKVFKSIQINNGNQNDILKMDKVMTKGDL